MSSYNFLIIKDVKYNGVSIDTYIKSQQIYMSSTYSLIKGEDQPIQSNTSTILSGFAPPVLPYHDNTSSITNSITWDLTTGIYTADADQTISLDLDLCWKGGISNMGDRKLSVIYQKSNSDPIVIKESDTQAEPNVNIDTTQEISTCLSLKAGDKIWIEVYHDAFDYDNKQPSILLISGSDKTSICGMRFLR